MTYIRSSVSARHCVSGVRRSKHKQHLYRCPVIFIALLHLLGGISLSVNNQVNYTQTGSGTPANFFYCYANSSNFFFFTSPKKKKNLPKPISTASTPQTFHFLPRRRNLRLSGGRVAEQYIVNLLTPNASLHSCASTWEARNKSLYFTIDEVSLDRY